MLNRTCLVIACGFLWAGALSLGRTTSGISDRGTCAELGGYRVLKLLTAGSRSATGYAFKVAPRVIFQDEQNNFWLPNQLGLYEYDEGGNELSSFAPEHERFSPRSIETICEDNKHRIWAFWSPGSSIRWFDGQRWHNGEELNPTVLSGPIYLMFGSSDRNIWFVGREGIVGYDGLSWGAPVRFTDALKSLYQRLPVRRANDSMAESEAIIDEFMRRGGAQHQEGEIDIASEVLSGLKDNKGDIWLAARRGLLRVDPHTNKWQVYALPSGLVEADKLCADTMGRIWYSDQHGHIAAVMPDGSSTVVFNLFDYLERRPLDSYDSTFYVLGIRQTRRNDLMFATERALFLYREKTKDILRLDTSNSCLPSDYVTAITEDRAHRLWIGTGNGIVVLDQ